MLPLSATEPLNKTPHTMKQESIELARIHIANAQKQLLAATRELVEAENLPDDTPVQLPVLTNLRITETYGGDESVLTVGFGIDYVPGLQLEYKGDVSDPNGPQEWTSIHVNAYPNELGTLATLNLWPSAGRVLTVRAAANGYASIQLSLNTSAEGFCYA